MRRRRTAYVDICPVCSDEKSTSDLDCPYCGYPMGKDWETVEIDLDTRVIIKTIIAAHRGGVMTNETQERKPLWSDGEIHARYTQAFGNPPDVHHFALLTWLRDEYEAQLAALAELRHEVEQVRQPQVAEWEPVPDGDYGLIGIQHDGERLCLYIDEPCRLPEGWRLMRPRAGEARN